MLNHVSERASSLPIVPLCMLNGTTDEMDNTLYLYAMYFSELDNTSRSLMLQKSPLHLRFYSWQGRKRQQLAWLNRLWYK